MKSSIKVTYMNILLYAKKIPERMAISLLGVQFS